MATRSITVTISLAWWFRWYLLGVVAMSRATGLRLNEDRFGYWFRRAVRVRPAKGRGASKVQSRLET